MVFIIKSGTTLNKWINTKKEAENVFLKLKVPAGTLIEV